MQDKKQLLDSLQEAYGTKTAKKLVKEIEKFKKKNPNKVFSFIFDEQGNFKAIPKEQ